MNILTQLPANNFITAAFTELLDDVTNLLTAARDQKPRDTDELKFWHAQFNALNKAEKYWSDGTRPTISGSAYLLPSASRPGALVHRLTRIGGILICSCEAGSKGTLCWHHQLACIVERAAELESLARTAEDVGSGPETGGNPIPHAAAAAAWVAGQITLAERLATTAQLLDAMRDAQQSHTSQDRQAQDAPRRLGLRLMEARKKSAAFASAFYLAA